MIESGKRERRNPIPHFLISFFPDSKNLNLLKSADLQSPWHPWSVSDPVQRFNGREAFVFIRVYSPGAP